MPQFILNKLLPLLFIFFLLSLSSCSILKKKKNCDCPKWTNNQNHYEEDFNQSV